MKATILQDETVMKAIPGNLDPEVINKVLIPKIIQIKYPELSDDEVEEVRQYVVVDSIVKSGEIKEVGDKRFIRLADKFVNIDDLHIDLIDRINPFQKAFEILSKDVTTKVLKVIQEVIEATRIQMTVEEALLLYPDKVRDFMDKNGRAPSVTSSDLLEKRMAEAIIYLTNLKRKKQSGQG